MGWFSKKKISPKSSEVQVERAPAELQLESLLRGLPANGKVVCAVVIGRGDPSKEEMKRVEKSTKKPYKNQRGKVIEMLGFHSAVKQDNWAAKLQKFDDRKVAVAEFAVHKEFSKLRAVLAVSSVMVMPFLFSDDARKMLDRMLFVHPLQQGTGAGSGLARYGNLVIVLTDCPEGVDESDWKDMFWAYERMFGPGEERNLVRYQLSLVFESVSFYFLPTWPPPPPPPRPGKRRRKQSDKYELPSVFTTMKEDIHGMLQKAEVLGPQQLSGAFRGEYEAARSADKDQSEEETKEMSKVGMHKWWASRSCDDACKWIDGIFKTFQESTPCSQEVLKRSFATAARRREKFLCDGLADDMTKPLLRQYATHVLQRWTVLEAENNAALDSLVGRLSAATTDKAREIFMKMRLPLPPTKLMASMNLMLENSMRDCVTSDEQAEALLGEDGELRKRILDHARDRCMELYSEMLKKNNEELESIGTRVHSTVIEAVSRQMQEWERHMKDAPWEARHLLRKVMKFADEAKDRAVEQLRSKLEKEKAEGFKTAIETAITNRTKQTFLANQQAVVNKVNDQLLECVDYFKQNVIRPQAQALVMMIANDQRELEEFRFRMKAGMPLPAVDDETYAKDYLPALHSSQNLERTLVVIILERAEFICTRSGFARHFTDFQRSSERIMHKQTGGGPIFTASGVPFMDGAGATPSQLFFAGVCGNEELVADPSYLDMLDTLMNEAALPQVLSQFRVFQVGTIERVLLALKKVAEEEIADLKRRQRMRDEMWRVTKPMLDKYQASDLGSAEEFVDRVYAGSSSDGGRRNDKFLILKVLSGELITFFFLMSPMVRHFII